MSEESPSRFAAALSERRSLPDAVKEVAAAANRLDGPADLAVVFISSHHVDASEDLGQRIRELTGAKTLIGCSGESIVGGAVEVEEEPAVSLWLAQLPDTRVRAMRLSFEPTSEGGSFSGWPEDLTGQWPDGSTLILLGEPFTFPADALVARLNDDHPGTLVVGGMASGGGRPGTHRLFLNDESFDQGAVAVLLEGAVRVTTVVSQGCRPIGRPFVITKSKANIIEQLGGKPPLLQFQDLYNELTDNDRSLVEKGLHLGRVINEYQEKFQRGDFLVRNVLGADRKSGAMAVGDMVRTGQTVQFHVRDAQTADEDLRELLASSREGGKPAGALLFTCNGRGKRLFADQHHDASTIQSILGDVPTAGFFAAGEIGPVGGRNFLHGFTASICLFSDRE